MAIYHCSAKIIGRSSGRSAVACSAYRSGESLEDEELGRKFDYTNKQGIEYTNIIIPENAPREFQDRKTLWNEVQKKESSNNSQMAREFVYAIPHELSDEESKKLADDIAKEFVKEGMCVDYAIHNPLNEKGETYNRHCHMMATTRQLKENGEWASKERKAYKLDADGNKIPIIDKKTGKQKIEKKTGRKVWERETVETNDWNTKEKLVEWRKRVADLTNKALKESGSQEQVTHLSLKDQGKSELPTIHEGYEARQIEKNGGVSERCEINREVREYNSLLLEERQLLKERIDTTKQLFEERMEQQYDRIELERNGSKLGEESERVGRFSQEGENLNSSLERTSREIGSSIKNVSERTTGTRELLQRERGTIEEYKRGTGQRIRANATGLRDRVKESISNRVSALRTGIKNIGTKIGLRSKSQPTVQLDEGDRRIMANMSRVNDIMANVRTQRLHDISEKNDMEKTRAQQIVENKQRLNESSSIHISDAPTSAMEKLERAKAKAEKERKESLEKDGKQEIQGNRATINTTTHHHRGRHI